MQLHDLPNETWYQNQLSRPITNQKDSYVHFVYYQQYSSICYMHYNNTNSYTIYQSSAQASIVLVLISIELSVHGIVLLY